ncbi:polypeptide N-acetylgalactosaminyltransferase 15 [Sorex fumeus]|uniref:polypeptide N-acetylgalactosaminyltransferase 15 n=1 Tax=Sorex fumeus TaxID=62283 RepID=UPI0024AD2B8C|nr:polypeptide N-acetylgalactosaminyltransferase 15 [Sorex fumeus]
MLLRKRGRHGPCGPQLLLLFLTLGGALLLVAVRHAPEPRPGPRGPAASAHPDARESQQRMLEGEEGQEYDPLDGLPPFISLREDQLLVVVASPRARRSQSQGRRAGSYRLIRQPGRRRAEEETADRDWAAEQEQEQEQEVAGEVSQEEVLTPLRLEEALSASIPLHRAPPEGRHPLCLQQRLATSLPTASVILCFHDEAWSTLLRTVHSILDTAPRAFLKEIVLVDDLSRQGQLKSALSEYVSRLEGVKLLRSNKRLGSSGARMLGATRATGDVLIFMDSHCECHPGWLEPLLSRIAGDRSRVVSPVLDVIDWKTFHYSPSEALQRGVLDWNLDFHWEALPEHERKKLESPISPIRTPVVPGGVVAVDRHHFLNTGAYDPLLSLRGSENLELSLKAWLCGGSVEILPCSRVGHIYRSPEALSPLDQKANLQSKVRMAEAWLGSFKDTFYRHSPEALSLRKVNRPDCTARLQLQRRLGCRTFHWFLANVHPELFPSERRPQFSGKLHNTGLGFCADCQADGALPGCGLTLASCSDSRKSQHLEHTGRKEIRVAGPQRLCLDVQQERVILENCTEGGSADHRQCWDFQENGMIVHILSGKCMEAITQENNKDLYLRQCDGKASQLWQFDVINPVDER